MQNDKTVEALVFGTDDFYQSGPVFRLHVAGINGRVKGAYRQAASQPFEFGHVLYEVFEVKTFKGACFGILHHTDGSAGVNE